MKLVHPVLVVLAALAYSEAFAARHQTGSTAPPSRSSFGQTEIHSRMVRWFESLLPDRLHGSIDVGPGHNAQFNAGFSRTSSSPIGSQRHWWLGDNVCVRNDQREETSSSLDSTDDDDTDDVTTDDRDLTNGGRFQFQNFHGHHGWRSEGSAARTSWRWQAGFGYADADISRGGDQTTAAWSQSRQRSGFRRSCEEVSSPSPQYRCTTVTHSGQSVTTRVTIYECCNGYQRAPKSNDGCNVEVLPDLMGSLEAVKANEMVRALNSTGLVELFGLTGQNDIMHTIFAPTDAAFAKYDLFKDIASNVVRISSESYSQLMERLYDVIGGHVVEGRVLSADMTDGLLLQSAGSRDSTSSVRINRFSNQRTGQTLLTANCVPLSTMDVRSSNGVVHIVDRVLPLPLANDTVENLIWQHPQLTVFASLLEKLTSSGELDGANGFTVIAPSDQAFARLSPSLRQKLAETDQCIINAQHNLMEFSIIRRTPFHKHLTLTVRSMQLCHAIELVKQHLLPQTVCMSAVSSMTSSGRQRSFDNLDRRPVHVTTYSVGTRSGSSRLTFIGGAGVVEVDLMASDGVVQVVDSVLFNDTIGGSLLEIASSRYRTNLFVELIERAGLRQQLESMDDFTLFLPSNSAVEAANDTLSNMSSGELREVIEYHLVPRALSSRDLQTDLPLTTRDQNNTLLVKDYHSFPFSHRSRKTVGCAVVRQMDINANSLCGGGIGHVVDTVLRRPAVSIMDLLSRDPQFSRLVSLITTSGLAEELSQADADEPLTFFAPNNNAFDSLPQSTLRRLTSSADIARRVLRSHVIPDILCCAGIFSPQLLQLPVSEVNLEGWLIEVNRNAQSVTFGGSSVRSCDLVAANGIVHSISRFSQSAIDRYMSGVPRTRGGILESLQELING